jgi:hypothetical protein
LKIPLFGALYKKIKIAQYSLHLTWKREKEEEMHFQKRQVHTKKNPKFLPVIPLLPTKLLLDELKDKAVYITFTLQVSKGSGPGTASGPLRKETPSSGWNHHRVERHLGSEFDHGPYGHVKYCSGYTQGR